MLNRSFRHYSVFKTKSFDMSKVRCLIVAFPGHLRYHSTLYCVFAFSYLVWLIFPIVDWDSKNNNLLVGSAGEKCHALPDNIRFLCLNAVTWLSLGKLQLPHTDKHKSSISLGCMITELCCCSVIFDNGHLIQCYGSSFDGWFEESYFFTFNEWASSRGYGSYHIGDQRRLRRACA